MSTFGARLREAIRLRNITQEELGDAIGVTQGGIGHMLKRDDPPKKIVEIAHALNVRVDWLALGEGPMEGERKLSTRMPGVQGEPAVYRADPAAAARSLVMIPRFDVQASAGPGAFADQELIIDYVAFQASWVWQTLNADPGDLALITATGDSMEMTIRSGDLLLINKAVNQFKDDAIYVIAIDGPLQVKRIQRFLSGDIAVKSDNPAYTEQRLTADEAGDLHIAGRVCWIARMI